MSSLAPLCSLNGTKSASVRALSHSLPLPLTALLTPVLVAGMRAPQAASSTDVALSSVSRASRLRAAAVLLSTSCLQYGCAERLTHRSAAFASKGSHTYLTSHRASNCAQECRRSLSAPPLPTRLPSRTFILLSAPSCCCR
jgi:hypothetical protein